MWEVPTRANPMAVHQALSTGKPIHGEPVKGIRTVPLPSTHAALLIAIVPLHSGLRLSGARKITGPTAPFEQFQPDQHAAIEGSPAALALSQGVFVLVELSTRAREQLIGWADLRSRRAIRGRA